MKSLFLRNILFTILHPGIVVGLFPYLLVKNDWPSKMMVWEIRNIAGNLIFITGLIVMSLCIINFATKGKGTLSPADPTRHLVISGLYKYSRNPMYVGVILMLMGESVFLKSMVLWLYTLAVFIVFNLFIWLLEEPRLKKDFGQEYAIYQQKVRRWI